jgi:hypothetical protein
MRGSDNLLANREELIKDGIIQITDRDFGPGKAMKWQPGQYFPFLGLWKSKKKPSLQGPGEFNKRKTKRREKRTHNTLLRQQHTNSSEISYVPLCRPPPKVEFPL